MKIIKRRKSIMISTVNIDYYSIYFLSNNLRIVTNIKIQGLIWGINYLRNLEINILAMSKKHLEIINPLFCSVKNRTKEREIRVKIKYIF